MKKKWLLIVACLSLSMTAICQTSGNSTDSMAAPVPLKDSAGADPDLHGLAAKEKDRMAKTLQPPVGKALVYILRPSSMGMLIRMRVRCDGRNIGSTKAENFLFAVVEPGKHTLQTTSENVETMDITVEAGKIYYVKQQAKMGFAFAETGLKLLDEKEGQKDLGKCRLAKDNVASN
jgi:Protein of unknown function (DUF2846)